MARSACFRTSASLPRSGLVTTPNGKNNPMRTTIDKAGRIVVPKRIRDRLGLRGGEQLEIEEDAGTIRIVRPTRAVRLVETEHGLLAAELDPPLPETTPDEVREALERTRR